MITLIWDNTEVGVVLYNLITQHKNKGKMMNHKQNKLDNH